MSLQILRAFVHVACVPEEPREDYKLEPLLHALNTRFNDILNQNAAHKHAFQNERPSATSRLMHNAVKNGACGDDDCPVHKAGVQLSARRSFDNALTPQTQEGFALLRRVFPTLCEAEEKKVHNDDCTRVHLVLSNAGRIPASASDDAKAKAAVHRAVDSMIEATRAAENVVHPQTVTTAIWRVLQQAENAGSLPTFLRPKAQPGEPGFSKIRLGMLVSSAPIWRDIQGDRRGFVMKNVSDEEILTLLAPSEQSAPVAEAAAQRPAGPPAVEQPAAPASVAIPAPLVATLERSLIQDCSALQSAVQAKQAELAALNNKRAATEAELARTSDELAVKRQALDKLKEAAAKAPVDERPAQ